MIIVIQCAARKTHRAGYLRTHDQQRVMFVAKPERAPPMDKMVYARPDDLSENGKSWRTRLLDYNRKYSTGLGYNPLGLLPAWRLYRNPTYKMLVDHCGLDHLYILSAGWGLIPAGFLTPNYDITFSKAKAVESYKQRDRRARYDDFRLLPSDAKTPIVFFGGRDYLSLFCEFTANASSPRTVFYRSEPGDSSEVNSGRTPSAPGCILCRFPTRGRTNWHYACARAFVEGHI